MKKILSVLLAVVTVLPLLFSLQVPVSAESLYIRKIVSVVYDDSGSMEGDKWAYANYATQAFCGMLNSEDQLFITYMSHSQSKSNYKPEKADLSKSKIQKSVDSIRKHTDSGSTPFGAVETAFQKLKSVKDSNPNTQYWLVVITDGDFDEIQLEADKKKKVKFLDEKFAGKKNKKGYVDEKMPNGTTPQITFLGIGDVAAPTEDKDKGIFTYSADNAKEIIGAMSNMAHKVSGRTRLEKSDIEQVDEKTVKVSSSIPLLNIAVFCQGSKAKVEKAVFEKESEIDISRKVSMEYPNYSDLVGSAYLLGDSKKPIGAGSYEITFDKKIDADDLIILFEPALEVKMTVTLNGKELKDPSELENAKEGDEVSASFKVYEMGTTKEIKSSLLPPGTKFELTVSEDGKEVEKVSGVGKELEGYKVKNADTEIKAEVLISGFNPIEHTEEFTPAKISYSVKAEFGSDTRSIQMNDLAGNKDMTVLFTVYADNTPITDVDTVKALNPKVEASPNGNSGVMSYSTDGKIVFTPNAGTAPSSCNGSFDVEVTCTLDNGESAKETYTVLTAKYVVFPVKPTGPIKKTQLYNNKIGASFYIEKDDKRLQKADVENGIAVSLNEEQAALGTDVAVAKDGTITVTPFSDVNRPLTFWNWWINWFYYFGLEGTDITVTLSHSYGTESVTLDVIEEDIVYQLLNVYLPLVIEIAVLAYLIWWIYCINAKPKFLPGAVIYMANLSYGGNRGNRYHEIDPITEVNLKQYNKLKYRWKPTLNSEKHDIGKNLRISAGYGGSIICHSEVWYKGDITPKARIHDELSHPQYVKTYIDDHDSLKIEVISPYDADAVHAEESIDNPNPELYYLHTKMANISTIGGIQVIDNGTIFAYAIRID